ncbi:MAG TPA: hypothetical protein VGC77_12480 [Rhodopseudomonas sp.]|uniref:hypothetical protein n=1 Tax=Rhodopseudomonas sp. TaxID=1078 RepID=UPI002EDA5BC9
MVKVTGFDNLQRQLDEAQRAFKSLDGQLATVHFDPENTESINAAIQTMESAIDGKVAPYRNNPFVAPLIPKMKAKYREPILERAKTAGQRRDIVAAEAKD